LALVQRIFYFHVASAWTFFGLHPVFHLERRLPLTRARQWDWLSVPPPVVGGVLFTLVLYRPIWASRVESGDLDAEVYFLVVAGGLFVSYLILRPRGRSERRAIVARYFRNLRCAGFRLCISRCWWFRTQHPQP